MGSFYTNVTVRHGAVEAVVQALEALPRTAFVRQPVNGCCVVFDRATEEQDTAELERLVRALSKRLACAVLGVLIHDDDLLYYVLFESGRKTDEYISRPGYFDGGDRPPEGGAARALAAAFDAHGGAGEVERVLHRAAYRVETERHADLVAALGLPEAAVGTGYRYILEGELPPHTPPEELRAVGEVELPDAPNVPAGSALSVEEIEAVQARMAEVVRPSPALGFVCGTEPVAYGVAISRVLTYVMSQGLARGGMLHPDEALVPILGPDPIAFGQLPLVLQSHFAPADGEGAKG
jgi:hypothetical protein